MKVIEVATGQQCLVKRLVGDDRFIARITAIGLTEGCALTVLHNHRKRPVLVYVRDSAVALDRTDCASIEVEVLP